MKRIWYMFFLLLLAGVSQAQNSPDTMKAQEQRTNADDPSNFLTRVEVYNELQHHENDFYFNQTVLRNIVQFGKRFSTRLDVPVVYNSFTSSANQQQFGIGDISFRLLGYKIIENPKRAITASIEVSLNTAQSNLLGTGKNMLTPLISYSLVIPKKKTLLALSLMQTNSVSGDETRSNVSFSKLQFIIIKSLSQKSRIVLAPEWFIDYVKGGVSMNLRSRYTYIPKPLINIWVSPSVGIFGDFIGRYKWSLDIGSRFFLFRKENLRQKSIVL
jgi:hypothetical protein